MRIVFICGSLVPGKDGVGDYCRRLAGELIRRGHQAALIALNKPTNGCEHGIQTDEETEIPVLRLSKNMSWEKRIKEAKQFITAFNPDWLSYQVSPYAYHSKGFPIRLPYRLKEIGDHYKWHIMVHEPFLRKGSLNYKEIIIRKLQILSLKLTKSLLQPVLWTTSIPIYKRMIEEELNVECKILGLFSNIPVYEGKSVLVEKDNENDEFVTAVYFGSAPVPKHYYHILEQMREQIPQLEKKLHLIFCGRMNNENNIFSNRVKTIVEEHKGKVSFSGELPASDVSNLFLSADFGIARVLPPFLGKSGVATAVLEHGVPLWVPLAVTENFKREIEFRPELCFSNLSRINSSIAKKEPLNRLPIIASTFIEYLLAS